MSQKREPSFKELRTALSKAARNPKADQRTRILLSSLNPEYYRQRALELIQESKEGDVLTQEARLDDAMLLLAAVKVLHGQAEEA